MFHLYGLIVGLGIVAGWSVAERIEPKVAKVLPWVLFFGIAGARLYHVIDLWGYYSIHVLQIFEVWNGGLGILGGIIGGAFGYAVYSVRSSVYIVDWHTIRAIATGLPLSQAIGRWGNLFNNELWGRRHEPLFLYESILDLVLFCLLCRVGRIGDKQVVATYLIGYGFIRLLLEPFKPDPWWVGYVMVIIMIILGFVIWYKSRIFVKS